MKRIKLPAMLVLIAVSGLDCVTFVTQYYEPGYSLMAGYLELALLRHLWQ